VALLAAVGGGVALWRGRPPAPPAEYGEPVLITPAEAANYLGRRCTVEMVVRSVGFGKTTSAVFLNSEPNWQDPKNFAAYIPTPARFKEAKVTNFEAHFLNRKIRVTGAVVRYNERLEIVVNDPSAIEMVGR
jgi:hypothetical protein